MSSSYLQRGVLESRLDMSCYIAVISPGMITSAASPVREHIQNAPLVMLFNVLFSRKASYELP